MRTLLQTILFSIAAMMLAGSAQAERPVRSLLEMRQHNLIMQQWDISCGAAALATILTYYKHFPVTEEQVARGMLRQTDPLRVRHRGGFSLLDMKRFAMQLGFASEGYAGMQLHDLAQHAPMIVPVRARGYDHFVIVRQVDQAGVHIGDPDYGNYLLPHARFTRVWPGVGFAVGERTALAAGES